MNIAQALGLFLTVWKGTHGPGSVVPFPGDQISWEVKHTDTNQDILARFHLFASLHPEKTAGQTFNVADGEVITWKNVWDGICQFFDLKGGLPETDGNSGAAWLVKNKDKWPVWENELGIKKGVLEATNWAFMDALMGKQRVHRYYDLSKIREVGFEDKIDTIKGYHDSFARKKSEIT